MVIVDEALLVEVGWMEEAGFKGVRDGVGGRSAETRFGLSLVDWLRWLFFVSLPVKSDWISQLKILIWVNQHFSVHLMSFPSY